MKRIPSSSSIIQAVCWLTSFLMLFSACSKQNEFEYIDEEVANTDERPNVTVTDENGSETTLTPGSTIGIYVVGEDGNVTLQRVEVDENGNAIIPASGQGAIIAYTPYQEDWGEEALTSNPVFTVENDQTTLERLRASDLMIGRTRQTTRAATDGSMTFLHMLSKVAIHIVDETGRVNLQAIAAELLGVNNSVTVDLVHQTVNNIEEERANIPMLSEMTTDWRISSYAIVAPQFVAEGTEFFAITLYGNRQTYPIPEAVTLEGGKTYTINMRLTEHGLLPVGWYITDWDEQEERNIDVKS